MTSTIIDVRAKLYTWKGPVQKIHENFCTNAADLVNQDNIANDKYKSISTEIDHAGPLNEYLSA